MLKKKELELLMSNVREAREYHSHMGSLKTYCSDLEYRNEEHAKWYFEQKVWFEKIETLMAFILGYDFVGDGFDLSEKEKTIPEDFITYLMNWVISEDGKRLMSGLPLKNNGEIRKGE